MHLLVCSNSGPARLRDPGEHLRAGAVGGLLPHLLSLLATGGEWFFTDAESGPPWPERAQRIGLHPIRVAERERRLHYESVSIETLLWLFHYLHDTATGPVFDAGFHQAWAAYQRVNERFAEHLAAAADGDETVVLVNDYHLLLVPGMLSRLRRPAGTRIVYSHQVPWCEPDYFGVLPGSVREPLLASLLSCDTVVFHASRWLESFARCCDRYLPAARLTTGPVVEYRDRATRLVAAPLPLDAGNVLRLQSAEAAERWRRRLDELSGGRRLLVRMDRLDLWKNHPRGFAAWEELLRRRPALAGEVWFLCLVARPRYRSRRHQTYELACRAAVAAINEAAGRRGRPEPVSLLFPSDAGGTRERGIAALSQASAVLVNPTYDGLNLVAKEAAALGETSAILLSRTAGAYEQLAPAVTPLDPFDVSGTADALEAAIVEGARAEAVRAADVRRRVRMEDAGTWLKAVLGREGAGPDL
jgi:trehalose 6-phosphate synthase